MLLEDSVFYNYLTEAVGQDAEGKQLVKGWLEYLYPLENRHFLVSAALFFYRGGGYSPPPPRTLDIVEC